MVNARDGQIGKNIDIVAKFLAILIDSYRHFSAREMNTIYLRIMIRCTTFFGYFSVTDIANSYPSYNKTKCGTSKVHLPHECHKKKLQETNYVYIC